MKFAEPLIRSFRGRVQMCCGGGEGRRKIGGSVARRRRRSSRWPTHPPVAADRRRRVRPEIRASTEGPDNHARTTLRARSTYPTPSATKRASKLYYYHCGSAACVNPPPDLCSITAAEEDFVYAISTSPNVPESSFLNGVNVARWKSS